MNRSPVKALAALLVLAGCSRNFDPPSQVAAPLSVYADKTTVAPLGRTALHGQGGTGAYHYGLIDAGTGAFIDDGGIYVAGAAGNTVDTVQVSDDQNAKATAVISVGAPLELLPPEVSLAPGGATSFFAQGGQPPYQLHMARHGNSSFGSVNPGGAYLAGVNPNVDDSVEVVDANGAARTSVVHVGAATLSLQLDTTPTPVTGDFNGDHITDAVVVSGTTVQVLLGTDTTPVLTQTFELPCHPDVNHLFAGDANGDGFDDLMLFCTPDVAAIFTSSFTGQLTIAAGSPWYFDTDGGTWDSVLTVFDSRPATPGVTVVVPFATGVIPNVQVVMAFLALSDGGIGSGLPDPGPYNVAGTAVVDMSTEDIMLQVVPLTGSYFIPGGKSAIYVARDILDLHPLEYLASNGTEPVPSIAIQDPSFECLKGKSALSADQMFLADLDGDGTADLFDFELNYDGGGPDVCIDFIHADGGSDPAIRVALPSATWQMDRLVADAAHAGVRFLFRTSPQATVFSWTDGGPRFDPESFPANVPSTAFSGDFNGDGITDLFAVTGDGELEYVPGDLLGHFLSGRVFHLRPGALTNGFSAVTGSPGYPAAALSTQDGVVLISSNLGRGLSLEGRFDPGQNVMRTLLGRSDFWAKAFNDAHLLHGALDGGSWIQAEPVPIDLTGKLHAILDQTGSWPGDLLLVEDAHQNLAIWPVGGDGGLAPIALGDLHDGTVCGLPSASGVLDDIVKQHDLQAPIEVYLGATDGSLSWPSDPSFSVDVSQLGADFSQLQVPGPAIRFAHRAGGPADAVLVDALSSVDHALHYFLFTPSTRGFTPLDVNVDYGRLAIGDFDGDGLNDVVAAAAPAGTGAFTMHLYRQQAGGGFTNEQLSVPPSSIIAMDLDGDGRAELIVSDLVHSTLTVLHNATVPGGPVTFN